MQGYDIVNGVPPSIYLGIGPSSLIKVIPNRR